MNLRENIGKRCRCWLGVLILGLAAGGCSQEPAGATVTGQVLLDGQPLADAVIRLWPKEDLSLGVYGGKTDAEGHIVLKLADNQRVKPGKYVVLVAKEAPRATTGAESKEMAEQITILSGPEGFRNLLPERYSDKAQSLLVFDIRNGPNDLGPLPLSSERK